ncbi:MAG: excinuclease ABC subunit UvrB, partial [Parvibaculum sp.]
MARDKFKSFGRGSERPLPGGMAEAPGASFIPADREALAQADRDTWAGALQGDPASWPLFAPHRPERPEKSEGGIRFKLVSEYEPAGDQPTAIAELVE